MNDIRLTFGATEYTLAALGVSEAGMTYNTLGPGTLTLHIPGAAAVVADDLIAYGAQVILKDHTIAGGPLVIFAGQRTDNESIANPGDPSITMQFRDAWWSLEHGTYYTTWNIASVSGGVTTYTTQPSPQVFLFTNIGSGGTAYGLWTAAQQIGDIIDFAGTFYSVPIQAGTIDPVITMPPMAVTSQSMADCINIMLRTLPDQTSGFDYTTSPPKLNIRARQNCTPITLPFANGMTSSPHHVSSRIKKRPDLQVPQVVINYKTTDPTSGLNIFSPDVYPPGSTGNVLQSLGLQFNLDGGQKTFETCTVNATAFDPTDINFWKAVKPDLAGTNVIVDATHPVVDTTINDSSSGHERGIKIVDTTGATVNISGTGALPNILSPKSSVASWMNVSGTPVVCKEVIITVWLKYIVQTATAGPVTTANYSAHRVDFRCKLTNSAAGAVPYTKQLAAVAGETPPPNFAYSLWCSLNNVALHLVSGLPVPPGSVPSLTAPENLQWEGSHTIIENGITHYYDCTNTLNLSGGNTAWASMNAKIYSVEYDLFRSTTTINFGAHKHPTPQQWWELQRLAQVRLAVNNPNTPSTGINPAGGGTDSPNDNEIHNTTEHSAPDKATDGTIGPLFNFPVLPSGTVSGYFKNIHDAGSNVGAYDEWGAHIIQAVKASDGTAVPNQNSWQIRLSDLNVSGAELESGSIVIKLRCVTGCDASGNPIYCYMPVSQSFSGTPPAGAPSF